MTSTDNRRYTDWEFENIMKHKQEDVPVNTLHTFVFVES